MTFDLRPYQNDALLAIKEANERGVKKQFVVLPTGTGKTVVFSHLDQALPDCYPLLILAHREELLAQAKEKIEAANPGLIVSVEQGANYAQSSDVVIASVPTLGRAKSSRLARFSRRYFKTVVIDEAHHAAAPTYKRILDYFDDAVRIGFTATPQRGDSTTLSDVFDEIVFYRNIIDMIKEGWLSPLSGYRLHTDVDLSTVKIVRGDFAEGELGKAVNIDARNEAIVEAYEKFLSGRQTVVFCVSVDHANAVSDAFNKKGYKSACVVGSTETEVRRDILKQFKEQRVNILSNCMVLTEGFDEPAISGIIMARPTQSKLLYTQAIGRGTRLYPDKEDCIVIDIADVTKGKTPVGLPSLMGLPSEFNLEGKQAHEVAEQFSRLGDTAPGEVVKVRSLDDLSLAWERIDLFALPEPDPMLLAYSTFTWVGVGDGHYSLSLGSGTSVHVEQDTLSRWRVYSREFIQGDEAGGLVRTEQCDLSSPLDTIQEAFVCADGWVKENAADKIALIYAGAGWRADPATDKQKRALRRFGVPVTSEMTKGHAAYLLDKLFEANPPKPRPVWLNNKIQAQKKSF